MKGNQMQGGSGGEFREEQRLKLPLWRPTFTVIVDDAGVHVRMKRLVLRTIPFANIERHELREDLLMRPLGLWGLQGGFGIKVIPGVASVYNPGNSRGVELELKSGRRAVIGSSRPEELHRDVIDGMNRSSTEQPSKHYSYSGREGEREEN